MLAGRKPELLTLSIMLGADSGRVASSRGFACTLMLRPRQTQSVGSLFRVPTSETEEN